MLCSSSTISNRFPHGLFDHRNELLHAERLLHAGSTGAAQGFDGLLVGDVAGDEHEPVGEFWSMCDNPGVHVGAVHAARGHHV
jgi:hypothetical protein